MNVTRSSRLTAVAIAVAIVLPVTTFDPSSVVLSFQAAPPARGADPQVTEARTALAAGRLPEALKLANEALVRTPADRDAAEVKIAVLLAWDQPREALAAYDAFVTALRRQDPALLKTIAVADLRRIARSRAADRIVLSAALERLARAGEADALKTLKQMAAGIPPATPDGLAPSLSLARLADPQSTAALGRLMDTASTEGRILLVKTIQDANATSQGPAVAARLDDPEHSVRAAAATAIGILQYRAALPRLRTMFASDVPIVQRSAALALKRLGDPSADTVVAGLLKSEIPDVRLMAAEAFQGARTQEWLPLLNALRSSPNELVRIRVAAALACCDRAAAQGILTTALNGHQLVRLEAARVLEDKGLGDAQLARRLLGDEFEPVRISGAGIAIALARSR